MENKLRKWTICRYSYQYWFRI